MFNSLFQGLADKLTVVRLAHIREAVAIEILSSEGAPEGVDVIIMIIRSPIS